LILDTAVENPRDLPALESGISAIAGIAAHLLQAGIAVDCFATTHLLCHLFKYAQPQRLTYLMRTLASLQASASVEWPSLASRLLEQAPTCHTMVLIALDWSHEHAAFVTRLQDHGIGVRTLIIRQGPTSQPLSTSTSLTVLLPGNPWPQDDSHLPWRGP
jgi:hypothetical protein